MLEEPTTTAENKNPFGAPPGNGHHPPAVDDRILMPPPMLPPLRIKRSDSVNGAKISSPVVSGSASAPVLSDAGAMKFEAKGEPQSGAEPAQQAPNGVPVTAGS